MKLIPGDLVYFKFRGIVGVVLPEQGTTFTPVDHRLYILIVTAPPSAPHKKGEIILELVDNLNRFHPDMGAHLLAW